MSAPVSAGCKSRQSSEPGLKVSCSPISEIEKELKCDAPSWNLCLGTTGGIKGRCHSDFHWFCSSVTTPSHWELSQFHTAVWLVLPPPNLGDRWPARRTEIPGEIQKLTHIWRCGSLHGVLFLSRTGYDAVLIENPMIGLVLCSK